MKKYIYSIFAILLSGMPAWAQPRVSFSEEVHDFGTVSWKRPVTQEFTVTNQGDAPLVLSNVTVSCGCALADWTQQPIPPGEKGFVKVTFDARQLGRFEKSVGIYTNATPNLRYLTFKGEVVTEAKNYKVSHPFLIGPARLDKTILDFGDIHPGDKAEITLEVVNTTRTPYRPVIMHLPPYLKAEASPELLNHEQRGEVRLILDSDKLKDYGLTQASVYLSRFPGDKVSGENELVVSAILLPDVPGYTEKQPGSAPKLTISQTEMDFSHLLHKEKITHTVELINTGGSQLEIQTLQVFNPALTVNLPKRSLMPGEKAKLRVTLNQRNLKELKRPLNILIITNDPTQPKSELKVTLGNAFN